MIYRLRALFCLLLRRLYAACNPHKVPPCEDREFHQYRPDGRCWNCGWYWWELK